MSAIFSNTTLKRMFAAFLLIGSLNVQAQENTNTGNELPPRVLPDLIHIRDSDVANHLELNQRGQELITMNVDGTSFHGLLLLGRSTKPQGGVLILHDDGQHGHWPENVAPLREELPTYGWTTLSIGLPDVPVHRIAHSRAGDTPSTPTETSPSDTTTATPVDEAIQTTTPETLDSNGVSTSSSPEEKTSSEPALPELTALPPITSTTATPVAQEPPKPSAADLYRSQMLGRIDAAVAELNKEGQLNIVIIATGHTAAWAVTWLEQKNLGQNAKSKGFSLILIDALDDAYAPVMLTDGLSKLDMPILDLVTTFNRNQKFANVQREGAMKRNSRTQYKQVQVPVLSMTEDYGNQITRRIRGWLKTNAAGMEAKVKEN